MKTAIRQAIDSINKEADVHKAVMEFYSGSRNSEAHNREKHKRQALIDFRNHTLSPLLKIEQNQLQKAFQEGWETPHGERCPQSGEEYFNQTFNK